MVKKSAKNRKSSTFGRPKQNPALILGRPGGVSGAAGGTFGGTFGGLEELPKACKTWNWAKSSRNLELGV